MEHITPTWDKLLADADKKFNGENDRSFVASLSKLERVAQLLAWLNYQVGNGGFRQWVDNGYGVYVNETIDVLALIGGEIAVDIAKMLMELEEYIDTSVENRGFFGNYWITEEPEPWISDDDDDDGWIEPDEEDCRGWDLCEDFDTKYYSFDDTWIPLVEKWLTDQP